MLVAGLLTAIVPYGTLNVASPVADALLHLGYRTAAGFIAAGAIAGLSTVMLVLYYGLTRVFLAMARDGLLPPVFSVINRRTHTPVRVVLVSGALIALIAGFTPIGEVAELVNIGTLAAFVLVCGGVIVLRRTRPDLPRPFKTPFSPLIPLLGMAFCLLPDDPSAGNHLGALRDLAGSWHGRLLRLFSLSQHGHRGDLMPRACTDSAAARDRGKCPGPVAPQAWRNCWAVWDSCLR